MAGLESTVRIERDFLERLRESSKLPRDYWIPFLGKEGEKSADPVVVVAERDLVRLAEELSLDANDVARKHVDFRALAAHQEGNLGRLPERYESGLSRIRTSAHLFDRIESLFGWRARTSILRRRQVTEAVIRDLDRQINLRFLTDVLEEIRALNVTDAGVFKLGEQSLVRNYHSVVGEQYRAAKDLREMYERGATEIFNKYYDRNTTYRLVKITPTRVVLDAIPNPEACEALKETRPGSRLVCLNKAGAFASLSGYRRLPFAAVRETSCIHRGDAVCRFEIDSTVPARHELAGNA
jgi:hypothetical protein